ncbi:four-helix bundle copper-binding protein [Nonomuraea sp. NPDC004580]|uniref:four-helix bundle copper-binding protein n=1 Tax=Nonomuraea sp. NPDC004580 TaxID=3154552 RepID=UPI0033B53475
MTSQVAEMLSAYPQDLGRVDQDRLIRCIEQCMSCAQACTACADACLSEPEVAELAKCVRSDLDCADLCEATARVLSRHTGYDANLTRAVLEACAQACKACGDECARHDHHPHCVTCAQACRDCEQACRELMAALG